MRANVTSTAGTVATKYRGYVTFDRRDVGMQIMINTARAPIIALSLLRTPYQTAKANVRTNKAAKPYPIACNQFGMNKYAADVVPGLSRLPKRFFAKRSGSTQT
jgi:hypothetical protein